MTEENLLHADVPEKFRDPETGEVKIDLLARSYKELEQRLSRAPVRPQNTGGLLHRVRARAVRFRSRCQPPFARQRLYTGSGTGSLQFGR